MPSFCLQCLRLMALGLLALGLLAPWYQLPAQASDGTLSAQQPAGVLVFKSLMVTGLVVATALSLKRSAKKTGSAVRTCSSSGRSRSPLIIATSGLTAVLLFFPYAIMVWMPTWSAQATELATSHDTLTWLGGDVYNAQEYEAVANKGSEIIKGAPRAIAITPAPAPLPGALALGKADEWFQWAGLTPAFSEFVKKGWMCSLLGLALLTISLLRVGLFSTRRKGDYGIARHAAKTFAVTFGLGASAVLIKVHCSARSLDKARVATAEGHAERALRAMNTAERWYPPLAFDTDLVRQRGLLDSQLKLDTQHHALHQAIGLETLGFEARAEGAFHALLNRDKLHPAIRAEARRGLMRFAVHDLNSGQTDRALKTFNRLYTEGAAYPRLNYAMQIAALRLGRDQQLAELVSDMETAYGYFQSPNKRAALSAGQRHLALAALERGDAYAAAFHDSKSRRP